MEERERLIQLLIDARQKMEAVVASIDPKTPVSDPWKIKEVLDHIAGWDDAVVVSIASYIEGEIPATPAERGIDHYNAQTVSTRETLSYQHSIREWRGTRELLLKTLREMPEDKFYQPYTLPWGQHGSVPQVIEIFSEHESTHADEIQAIIDQSS